MQKGLAIFFYTHLIGCAPQTLVSKFDAISLRKHIVSICLVACCFPAWAAELALLGGVQFNADLEVVDEPAMQTNGEPVAGEDVEVDTKVAFGAELDFVLNRHPDQRFGFFFSHMQTEFDSVSGISDNDLAISHLHLTFKNYYPQGTWRHFVLGGLGVTHVAPEDNSLSSKERFSGQLAFGTNYALSKRLALRAEARWIATFFDDSTSSVFCNGGCVVTVRSEVYNQVLANLGLVFNF